MGVDDDKDRARDLANLRLEINALASRMEAASLPDALRSVKRTITWSAVGIAVALVLSGLLHLWGSTKVDRLEERVLRLERYHSERP